MAKYLDSAGVTRLLTAIKSKIIEAKDANLLMLGDSWLAGGGWGTSLANYMKAKNSYNYGVAGSGFARSGYTTFHSQLETAISEITDKKSITHIVVGGGINDQWDNIDTLKSAVKLLCVDAHANFPNAKIYYFANHGSAAFTRSYYDILLQIKNTVIESGGIVLEDIEYSMMDAGTSYMNTDNVHPTANGYAIIAKSVYNAINGNKYSFLGSSKYTNGIVNTRITRNGHVVTFDCSLKATAAGDYTNGLYLGTCPVGKPTTNKTYAEKCLYDRAGTRVGYITFATNGVQLWNVNSSASVGSHISVSFDFVGLLD